MKFDNNIEVFSPRAFPDEQYSEAEILGSMTWIWSQFDYYKGASIEAACNILSLTIRSKNFALFTVNQQPIGYANWAYLDPETEKKCKCKELSYEELITHDIPHDNKSLWLLSIFSLPGKRNLLTIRNLLEKHIFVNQKVHFAYHKSDHQNSRFYTKMC